MGELYYGRYFVLISPADQLYIENLVSRVPHCYGSHYLQRDDANVMSLLSGLRQLQARGDNIAGEYFLTNFGVNCDPGIHINTVPIRIPVTAHLCSDPSSI